MKILCDSCNEVLKEKGGLAFSPPLPVNGGSRRLTVDKYDICVKCWSLMLRWIRADKE